MAEQITLDALLLSKSPLPRFDLVPTEWIRLVPGLPPSAALEESVRAHGIMQPVILNTLESGQYECIAGARRIQAARTCGLAKVPAMIYALPEYAGALLSMPIVENEIRAGNLALASQHIDQLFTVGADETMLAGALNLSKSKVRAIRKVWTNLIPAFHDPFLTGKLRAGVARAAGKLTIPQQKELYDLFAANGKLSVADVARVKLGGVQQQEELPGIETGADSWKPKARSLATHLESVIRSEAKDNTSAAELLARYTALMGEYGLRGFASEPDDAGDAPAVEAMGMPDLTPAPLDLPGLPGSADDLDEPVMSIFIPEGLSVDDVTGGEIAAKPRRRKAAPV